MPKYIDSVDKIVYSYFRACVKRPFEYRGRVVEPTPGLVVSRKLFRTLECVEKCGACCPRFSLDYLPTETEAIRELKLSPREVVMNGKKLLIYSDLQQDNMDYHCRHLNKENGRCMIHRLRPFSCDFEILRFINTAKRSYLMTRPYGRAWNMLQYDGVTRGAKCIITETCSQEEQEDIMRKLNRLLHWVAYFGFTDDRLREAAGFFWRD
jgi:Fe-S-cluster containining protein